MRNQKNYGNEKEKNMSQGDLTSYHNDKVQVNIVSKHKSESKSYVSVKNSIYFLIVYSYAGADYYSVAVLGKKSQKKLNQNLPLLC